MERSEGPDETVESMRRNECFFLGTVNVGETGGSSSFWTVEIDDLTLASTKREKFF
jgi:hypothetical protein